ncbi:MAG: baseplate J/gp47 family protein [Chloroflexota bacterium]
MPIPSPNLDDRSFRALLEEARATVLSRAPAWTDQSTSDPGIVLLEAFAYLTEVMIYRLNRVPDKAYHEFLRLIGVRMHPPAAAGADLTFTRAKTPAQAVEIPRGTQVTVEQPGSGSPPPVFVTTVPATIAAGQPSAAGVPALHCELVDAELLGTATGAAGLFFTLRRPPVIGPTADGLDLVVAVEATAAELGERVPALSYGGRSFRIWQEVDNFSDAGPDDTIYLADRLAGTITFAPAVDRSGGSAPAALAAIPAANREIRAWYRRGGGPEGNLGLGTLTALKTPVAGVQLTVTNPAGATGGRAAETLENALLRGPQELYALNRAVTARDFELFAERSGAVARARAFTRAGLWRFAPPGTVEVVIVPDVGAAGAAGVGPEVLAEQQTDDAQRQIQATLEDRKPLGTACLVSWARYKTVTITGRLGVRREEDFAAVRARVLNTLHQRVTPLPTALNPAGWPFGQALRVSDVYYLAQLEPAVRWVDRVQLRVDEVPSAPPSVAADPIQPRTWYACSGGTLFRSVNDGDGWEPAGLFEGEQAELVRPHPGRPGLLVVAAALADGTSRLHLSNDCAESFEPAAATLNFHVNDLAWVIRDEVPVLLMATDRGLYELSTAPGATPVQVLVDPANQALGFYAVCSTVEARGEVTVAVAAQQTRGVYLSNNRGSSQSFRSIGPPHEDIRVLAVQKVGPQSFLWAGVAVEGVDDPGKGCFSWELRGAEDPPERWIGHQDGWRAGSCRELAFQESRVLAASHHGGVQALDSGQAAAAWQAPAVTCGLPLRDPGRFFPVDALAANPARPIALAGGGHGLFRTQDSGVSFTSCAETIFTDQVTIPPTWLFCSGPHELEVVDADEAH